MATEEKKPTMKEILAERQRKTELAEATQEAGTALVHQQAERQLAQIPSWALDLTEWDWKKLKPYEAALLLMQKPYTKYDSGQKEIYRLDFAQAITLAYRSSRLGLDPFSTEVWFNPENWQVAPTVEGKRKMAQDRGINFGPPVYSFVERDWPTNILNIGKFPKDIMGTCTMEIRGWKTPATYTGALSEWYKGKGPGSKKPWDVSPLNQFMVRLQGQCLTFALGVGISAMPDEGTFTQGSEEEGANTPGPNKVIDVREQDFQPLPAVEQPPQQAVDAAK